MIENIRKYSGLTIVVFAIVFISFLFIDTNSMRGMSGSPTVMKIGGRNYTEKEFRVLGAASAELIMGLGQSGDFPLLLAYSPLFGNRFEQDGMAKNLFVGRILVRQAQDEFGIHPTDEEVASYIRKLRAFTSADGDFDGEAYNRFVSRVLGRYGMTEKDLRGIASDAIVLEKLQKVLGSGLGTDRGTVAANMALDNQEVSVELARLDLDAYQDKIDPKEEDIKAYWESIQDQFKTEVRRKFSYVIISPEAVAEPAPEAPAAPLPADATEEAKTAAKKAEDDKKAAAAAKLDEAKRAAQIKADGSADEFYNTLLDQHGSGFEDLAKKFGWEVKTADFFPLSAPPAELNIDLRASSTGGKAPQTLFQIQDTGDAASKISPAIPVGEGQWLIARLDGEEPSRVKTYAEARSDARAQYISEKGVEALKKGAEEAAGKIKESIKAGKSFADAAKEAGINETRKAEKVSRSYRPDPVDEPQGLFEAVREIDPGSLANNIVESDRAFIIHVVKREVVKEPNADARIDAEVNNATNQNETAAFMSWLSEKIEDAKVEDLYASR